MLEKQQSLDIRIRVVNISCCLGQVETGHDVRHNAEPVTEDFAATLNGVRQIGQNKECCRVGVVNKPMGQIGMKQGFNRGVRCRAVEKVVPLNIDHVFIRKRIESAQPFQRLQPDPGQSSSLDDFEIPPRTFDVKNILHVTK